MGLVLLLSLELCFQMFYLLTQLQGYSSKFRRFNREYSEKSFSPLFPTVWSAPWKQSPTPVSCNSFQRYFMHFKSNAYIHTCIFHTQRETVLPRLLFRFTAYLTDLSLSAWRTASFFFTPAQYPIVCMHDIYQSSMERKVVSYILLLQTIMQLILVSIILHIYLLDDYLSVGISQLRLSKKFKQQCKS